MVVNNMGNVFKVCRFLCLVPLESRVIFRDNFIYFSCHEFSIGPTHTWFVQAYGYEIMEFGKESHVQVLTLLVRAFFGST